MFKRKPKKLVEIKKVNKMLNEILKTERCMVQSSNGWAMCGGAIPTNCVLHIAQKYGFLKEKEDEIRE